MKKDPGLAKMTDNDLKDALIRKYIQTGVTLLTLCHQALFFKSHFLNPETWFPWFTFLKCLFGIEMNEAERAFAYKLTGRTEFPNKQFKEAWLVCGRRSGKSAFLGLVAVFFAVFRDHSRYLKPGEVATIMVIAADRDQARIIFRYALALLAETPVLKHMIARETKEKIELTNRCNIEIHTTSFRSVRGYTIPAALLDETAFWRDDTSSNPDVEVLNALMPGMATVPNPIIIGASSPYARRGILYQRYREFYGVNNEDVLVWQAPTAVMNPTIDPRFLEKEYAKDPAAADAEYGANFRRDIEAFIPKDLIDQYTIKDRLMINWQPNVVYHAWVDPSGGAQDSFTLGIAHEENDAAVIDRLVEWEPPFNPESVISQCAAVLGQYNLSNVVGDLYAGDWVASAFRQHDVTYAPSPMNKSDVYRAYLPLLMAGKSQLLDIPKLRAQLGNLERRLHAGGREIIDHPPRTHDDLANSAAGCSILALPMRERWNEEHLISAEPLITASHEPVYGPSEMEYPAWHTGLRR